MCIILYFYIITKKKNYYDFDISKSLISQYFKINFFKIFYKRLITLIYNFFEFYPNVLKNVNDTNSLGKIDIQFI